MILLRVNRTQGLVIGFFLSVWLLIATIAVAAPDVFADAMDLPLTNRTAHFLVLGALSAFLFVLSAGVVRRWHLMFWLVLVAFAAGILRIPASALQLAGVLAATAPGWYLVLQGTLGVVQVVIAFAMFRGYRARGVWGAW